MPGHQKRALRAIIACRTRKQGIMYYKCESCGEMKGIYRSCGNRHCPTCQTHKSREWMEKRIKNMLPGPHYAVTFTVPDALKPFMLVHQKEAYSMLFQASSKALSTSIAKAPHIKGEISGFLGVIHTWGRLMPNHPHIHFLVPAGALSKDGSQWYPMPNGHFIQKGALATLVRKKLTDLFKKAGLLNEIPADAWNNPFNVNITYVGDGQSFIKYLTPTIFKVGIHENQIEKIEGDQITITYRKTGSNRIRRLNFTAMEFIRRYLQHVLPSGFMKVRYYGFMHPASKHKLQDVRKKAIEALGFVDIVPPPEVTLAPPLCTSCGSLMVYYATVQPHDMPPDKPG